MMRWVWTTKSCKCDSVCHCVITLCVAVWSQCVRRNRGDCARKDLWLPQQSIGRWGQVCVNANVLLFVTILPHVLIRSFFLVFARFFSWKSFNIFPFFSANVPKAEVNHCSHMEWGPKFFKMGTKWRPHFEWNGDQMGTFGNRNGDLKSVYLINWPKRANSLK